MDEQKTITQQVEDIKEDICMNYCKYPDITILTTTKEWNYGTATFAITVH
jgi:hypothetical protein